MENSVSRENCDSRGWWISVLISIDFNVTGMEYQIVADFNILK